MSAVVIVGAQWGDEGKGKIVDIYTEHDELETRGHIRPKKLLVSDRSHAILPYHVLVDGLREQGKGAIGTTKRGVGPCYEDKVARRGIPLGAFRDPARMKELVAIALDAWAPVIRAMTDEPI